MKRMQALQSLSREHHQALVVASRLGRGDSDEALAGYWQQLEASFFPPLEAHFAEEERWLLPLLSENAALAERLRDDHRQLRALMAADRADQWRRFGLLLRDHVRFEEKTLFEWLQRHYGPDRLLAAAGA